MLQIALSDTIYLWHILLTMVISSSFWHNISLFISHECLKTVNETIINTFTKQNVMHRNIKINSHNCNRYLLVYKQMEISTSSLGECQKCNILVVTQALVLCLICVPSTFGIHIRQSTRACITTTYVTWFAKTRHNSGFNISRNTTFKYSSHCSFLMPCCMDARFTL